MLILSRKPGQGLVIDTKQAERVRVIVTGRKGENVKLGIIADKSVTVNRDEVQERIQASWGPVDIGGEG